MSGWARGTEEMEEANDDGMLEGELAQLQLRYRVMQNSIHTYKQDTKRKIIKQRSIVESLELDNIELTNILGKLESTQNTAQDEANTGKLKDLSKSKTDFQRGINDEKDKIKAINAQTEVIEKEIAKQRRNMSGDHHNATANFYKKKKQIRALENRVEKTNSSFSKQLVTNEKLRSAINELRRERVVFDKLYKKLAHALEKSKRETTSVIKESTEAFEQRDDARSKTLVLIDHSEEDKKHHTMQIRDMQRMIQHDNHIRQFMCAKGDDRAALKNEETAKRQKIELEKLANADQVSIAHYEETMSKLRETTKEDNIDDIVEVYEKNEKENFALFNYVTELNHELDTLADQATAVRDDIAQFQIEDETLAEVHESMLRQREEEIDAIVTVTDQAETNLRRVNKLRDELLSGIHELFLHIGCDQKPISDMLDNDHTIRAKNVMVYLGQIEQRTTELLAAKSYFQKQQEAIDGVMPKKFVSFPPKPIGVTEFRLSASLPSFDEIPEGKLVGDIIPLTQEELRCQVARMLDVQGNNSYQQQSPAPSNSPRDKKKKQLK